MQLRMADDKPQTLVYAIRTPIDSEGNPTVVRIYRNAKLRADFVVHLHREKFAIRMPPVMAELVPRQNKSRISHYITTG